jgi:hypothetical protein
VSLVRKQQAELVRLRAQLSNLLAVIHRDGGQYEQQHGTEVAMQAATVLVVQMMVECDAIRLQLARWQAMPPTKGQP